MENKDYKEYKKYETVPEIVSKNKNNIQYLKEHNPEDLKPLIDENTKNITLNTNDITELENDIATNKNAIATNTLDIIANTNDITNKQNKLIAGTNIKIVGDTISATGGGSEVWEDISFSYKNNIITINKIIPLFSKINIEGKITSIEKPNIIYLNLKVNVDEVEGKTLFLCETENFDWLGRGEFNIYNNTITIKSYNMVENSSHSPPIKTPNFTIKGVRK